MRSILFLTFWLLLQPALASAEQPPPGAAAGVAAQATPDAKPWVERNRLELFGESAWPQGTFVNDVYGAYAKAYTDSRPLLIFFAAEWCSYCATMKREVLGTPEFAAIQGRGVLLILDVAKDDELGNVKQLMTRLGITEFPAFAVMDVSTQEINVLGRIVGYHNPPQFLNVLSQIMPMSTHPDVSDPPTQPGPFDAPCPSGSTPGASALGLPDPGGNGPNPFVDACPP